MARGLGAERDVTEPAVVGYAEQRGRFPQNDRFRMLLLWR